MTQITGPFKLKKNIFNRRRKQREEDALNAAWAEQQRNMDIAAQSAMQQMTQQTTQRVADDTAKFNAEQAVTKFLIPKSTIDPNFSLSDITNSAIRDIEERERITRERERIAREKAEQERLVQEKLAQEAINNERENARREQRIQDAEEYGYEAMNVVGHPQIVQKERKEGEFIPGISLLPKEEKPEYGIHILDIPEPFQPRFIEVKSSKTTQKPKPLIKKKKSGVLPSTNQAYNQYVSETNEAGGTPVTQFIYEATSQQYPFRTAEEIASTSKTTQNKNNKSSKKSPAKKSQPVKTTKSNNPSYNEYVQQATDNGVTPVNQWIFEATTQKYPHLTIDQIVSQAKATKQPAKQSSTQPATPLILQNNNKPKANFTQPFWMNQKEHRW